MLKMYTLIKVTDGKTYTMNMWGKPDTFSTKYSLFLNEKELIKRVKSGLGGWQPCTTYACDYTQLKNKCHQILIEKLKLTDKLDQTRQNLIDNLLEDFYTDKHSPCDSEIAAGEAIRLLSPFKS